MNLFIIPANSNQGKLIFSLFTKFDLILVSSGFAITLLSLMIFTINSFQMFVIIMLPALITALLVVPIPNYHNVYTVIKEIIQFFYKRRNYRWEGWCSLDEFK